MILIKYLDLYGNYTDEDGNTCTELLLQNATVPFELKNEEILTISPYFSRSGRLYKNVSLIADRYGNSYKVVGNYKKIIEIKNNPNRAQIGYGTTNKV